MSLKQDGVIIVLSSPSGAGKTTLVKKISNLKKFSISISYTTRIPRKSEVNGEDYYFISESEFKNLINDNEFGLLNNGKNVIFDIDWQGTKQIKEKNVNYKLITFFILPPSKKTLLNRLSERENNDKKIINERMESFNRDILHWEDYDYVVINDNLEICLNEIIEIIDSELNNKKIIYDKNKIKKHIQNLIN